MHSAKASLRFFVSIFFLAQIQKPLKKKNISTIFWVWYYSLFCHQKLVPFGECIGLVFLFCFVLFFFCRCLFVFFWCVFCLACLFFLLFVFSLVCLEIIESIIKSFITFGLFALIFFTYQSTLKQDFWQVSASNLHFSK